MKRAVVDASFAGAWLLPDEREAEADALLDRILAGRCEVAVPALWTYEMLNLLVSAHRRKRIDSDQIGEGQRLLAAVPLVLYDHTDALTRERLSGFALRFGLSAYDAAYLELADRLQVPLHTSDHALARAARELGLEKLAR